MAAAEAVWQASDAVACLDGGLHLRRRGVGGNRASAFERGSHAWDVVVAVAPVAAAVAATVAAAAADEKQDRKKGRKEESKHGREDYAAARESHLWNTARLRPFRAGRGIAT